jgi:pilus assembly protein Flp/PilA
MDVLHKLLTRSHERGASAVEYGLLIAGIAAIIVVAVFALGGVTDGAFKDTCVKYDDAMQAAASC